MAKRLLLALCLLIVAVSGALAQSRQPAQMSVTPTTNPVGLYVLDPAGNYIPVGSFPVGGPFTPVGGGGGGGTITNGTTPTAGFTNGNILVSSGGFIGQISPSTFLQGTLSGNTTLVPTLDAAPINGDCPQFDSHGGFIPITCTGGGGGSGTVNAGLANQLAYYITSTNAVSGLTTNAGNLTMLGVAPNASGGATLTSGSLVTNDCTTWGPGSKDSGVGCVNGGIVLAPPSGLNLGLSGTQTGTGTLTTVLSCFSGAVFNYNQICITDEINSAGAYSAHNTTQKAALNIQVNEFGGATGNTIAILGTTYVAGTASGLNNTAANFVGSQGVTTIAATLGGTNPAIIADTVGAGFGGAFYATNAGCTACTLLAGIEIDVASNVGFSEAGRFGAWIVDADAIGGTVGSFSDAAIGISSLKGVGWGNGILITQFNNTGQPIQSGGSLFATQGAITAASGFDVRSATFSSFALGVPNNSPLVAENAGGTGTVQIGLVNASNVLTLGTGSAGVTIPVAVTLSNLAGGTVQCVQASAVGLLSLSGIGCGGSAGSPVFPVPVSGAVTAGGIPYFASTTSMQSSTQLVANALVIGGGTGSGPSTVTTGTNVLTALAANIGVAGAVVVSGSNYAGIIEQGSANFVAPFNYHGTFANSRLGLVGGSTGTPMNTADVVVMVEKIGVGLTGGGNTGPTGAIWGHVIDAGGAASAPWHGSGVIGEAESSVAYGTPGPFLEGLHGQCLINTGSTNLNCDGTASAVTYYGTNHVNAAGIEGLVNNQSGVNDASGNFQNQAFLASTIIGTNAVNAAYVINENNTAVFHLGFWVPPGTTEVDMADIELDNTALTGIRINGTFTDFQIQATGFFVNSLGYLSTVGMIGVTNGSNSVAGNVGEAQASDVPPGSAVPMTAGLATNITSVSLTAGDWDCFANATVNNSGSTITVLSGWISSTSATVPPDLESAGFGRAYPVATINFVPAVTMGKVRFSLTSTTTVYLQMSSAFTGGTVSAYGVLSCRRVR